MTVTLSRWKCIGRGIKSGCGANGEGTFAGVQKAAEKHGKQTGHGTIAGAEAKR